MKRFSLVLCLIMSLFFMGLAGFCEKADYNPVSISIMSPAKGTVLEPGIPAVIIKGKVKAGDKVPTRLSVNGKAIAFNSSTGDFSYQFPIPANAKTATCQFEVQDQGMVTNRERATYFIGGSSLPGDTGVVDNAISIVLTNSLLGKVCNIANNIANRYKEDIIYGWDSTPYGSKDPAGPFSSMSPLLPVRVDIPDGMDGWATIDPKMTDKDTGYINIGNIILNANIVEGNQIEGSIDIGPEAWVNPRGDGAKALFVQGHYRTYPAGITTRIHFTLMVNSIHITDVKISTYVNADNKIALKADLTQSQIILNGKTFEFGFITAEDEILSWIVDLVKDQIMSQLALDLPVISINDIAFQIMGLNINGWPMTSSIFTTKENEMKVDLGLGAKLSEGTTPLFPSLEKFYSTLPNTSPDVAPGSSNVALAVSDDLLNEACFDVIQLGILKELDLTNEVKSLLGQLANGREIIAKVSMKTPPIADFSGMYDNQMLSSTITDIGRFIVKDIQIDLFYKGSILPLKFAARINTDVDLVMKLELTDDGRIKAHIDTDKSKIVFNVLYTNVINTALIPEISNKLTVKIAEMLVSQVVDFEVPTFDVFGNNIGINVIGTELQNNYLIMKVLIF